jgi:hypothetical protein
LVVQTTIVRTVDLLIAQGIKDDASLLTLPGLGFLPDALGKYQQMPKV